MTSAEKALHELAASQLSAAKATLDRLRKLTQSSEKVRRDPLLGVSGWSIVRAHVELNHASICLLQCHKDAEFAVEKSRAAEHTYRVLLQELRKHFVTTKTETGYSFQAKPERDLSHGVVKD